MTPDTVNTIAQRRPHSMLRDVSILVTGVVVVLTIVTLLSYHGVTRPTNANTRLSSAHLAQAPFGGWNSVVIGISHSGALPALDVEVYDPGSARHAPLVMQPPYLASNTLIDGVSHDGQNLLYQFPSSDHMLYFTLMPLRNTGFFYELNTANAGNALWLSDSRHALILSTNVGVMEVDTQTGQAKNVLSLPLSKSGQQVQIGRLTFYRNGYLYFVGAGGACEGILCRVQLSTRNASVQQVSFRSPGATYWLSPDGSTFFFANKQGPAGQPGIYAVHNDGTHLRLLRNYPDGTPIGYAADSSLEIMRVIKGKFAVVKLGSSPQKDRVVLADAAPGAANLCSPADLPSTPTICDTNIALAPYGHAVVMLATYTDGNYKIWSDDLTTSKKQVLFILGSHVQVQLPGWSRIPV